MTAVVFDDGSEGLPLAASSRATSSSPPARRSRAPRTSRNIDPRGTAPNQCPIVLTELLLHHIRDLMGAIRARTFRLADSAINPHSHLDQFDVMVVEPRLHAFVGPCPVPSKCRNVRSLTGSRLDPQHPASTLCQTAIHLRPNIKLPIVVERQIEVCINDSQPLKLFPVGLTTPVVVFGNPDTAMAVGVENLPESRVQVFITKERSYAALSNAVARRRRYSSIR